MADRVPANCRTDKPLCVLQFLIERFGRFRISMPTEQHRDTGQRAAHVANRIFRVAEAEDVTFPFGILLGEVDKLECHRITSFGSEGRWDDYTLGRNLYFLKKNHGLRSKEPAHVNPTGALNSSNL